MAQIHEEVIIIRLSKLVKNDAEAGVLASVDIVAALEQVVQELVGETVIVEVEAA